jgi:hypothetical protein
MMRRKICKGSGIEPSKIPTIINNTPWSLEKVRTFQRYGGFMNYWRQRKVDVLQPPAEWIAKNDGQWVVSVGFNFQTNTYWICLETFSNYASRIINADWSDYR